ncbi:MAG: hypothetical protein ACLGHL_09890 [Actinomycetota bacterium]
MILAQAGLAELTEDPLLSVAAVMLIVVSVGWIAISRMITREIRRQALRRRRSSTTKKPSKDRDIWSYPP